MDGYCEFPGWCITRSGTKEKKEDENRIKDSSNKLTNHCKSDSPYVSSKKAGLKKPPTFSPRFFLALQCRGGSGPSSLEKVAVKAI